MNLQDFVIQLYRIDSSKCTRIDFSSNKSGEVLIRSLKPTAYYIYQYIPSEANLFDIKSDLDRNGIRYLAYPEKLKFFFRLFSAKREALLIYPWKDFMAEYQFGNYLCLLSKEKNIDIKTLEKWIENALESGLNDLDSTFYGGLVNDIHLIDNADAIITTNYDSNHDFSILASSTTQSKFINRLEEMSRDGSIENLEFSDYYREGTNVQY